MYLENSAKGPLFVHFVINTEQFYILYTYVWVYKI
jgi:hypothetical protein